MLECFLRIGHTREAEKFNRWLSELSRRIGGAGSIKPLYRVTGEDDLAELELDHLEGYRGSRPVRVGNGAASQLQLDIYGAATQLAFLMCSYWLVELLARMGELQEAVRLFERLRALGGPLGLFAGKVDPRTHEHLGNFPQGFSHMALIAAATAIDEELRSRSRSIASIRRDPEVSASITGRSPRPPASDTGPDATSVNRRDR